MITTDRERRTEISPVEDVHPVLVADDHEDAVLPGYTSSAPAYDDQGNPLGSPIRDRYPWRLAPAAVVWESTSHVVFGTALEAMRRVLRG